MKGKDPWEVVTGHDDLRSEAERTFAPLDVEVVQFGDKVGITLPYGDRRVLVLKGKGNRWYPTHGRGCEMCGWSVRSAKEFQDHMAESVID